MSEENASRPSDIAVCNKIVNINGKMTNVAVWAPVDQLKSNLELSSKPIRYYLKHQGAAKRVRSLMPCRGESKIKLCVMFPGYNGGPFDLWHVAEALARRGYWVVSAGCHIDSDLNSSSPNEDVARSLSSVYPSYNRLLDDFISAYMHDAKYDEILYVSFSSGIYPFLRCLSNTELKKVQHKMILIAPGLSNMLPDSVSVSNIERILLIHSEKDLYPKFGSPLNYMQKLKNTEKQLCLLEDGLHFDFVNLPSDQHDHTKNDVSNVEHDVKRRCIESISLFLDSEIEYEH